MAIRVAHIGTGNVGIHALTALITNPDYELTGVWVSSDAKAGKDAGELAGLDVSTGVKATTDLDEVLADQAGLRGVHRAGRQPPARGARGLPAHPGGRRQRRRQRTGVPAVSVAGHPGRADRSDRRGCRAREIRASSSTGSIPASPTICLPLALAGTCQSIQQVRCMEIVDYATYDSATVMFDVMGFGKPLDEIPMLLQTGVLSMAWGSVIRQIAAGLGVDLDGIEEMYVREPAPEDFDISAGHIAKGTAAALRFEVIGIVDGAPAVVLEHVTRLREDLCPEWPQPAQEGGSYRIEITGEPSYAVDVCLGSPNGDHNHAGLVATAMRVVNAIPAVVAAAPGIRTTLDLPLVTGKGLYVASCARPTEGFCQ